jgi:hypothetical protein
VRHRRLRLRLDRSTFFLQRTHFITVRLGKNFGIKKVYVDSATNRLRCETTTKGNTTMVGPRRITYVASERLAKVRCSSLSCISPFTVQRSTLRLVLFFPRTAIVLLSFTPSLLPSALFDLRAKLPMLSPYFVPPPHAGAT